MRIRLITQNHLVIEADDRSPLPKYFFMPKFNPRPVVPGVGELSLSAIVEKREFIFHHISGDIGYYYEVN